MAATVDGTPAITAMAITATRKLGDTMRPKKHLHRRLWPPGPRLHNGGEFAIIDWHFKDPKRITLHRCSATGCKDASRSIEYGEGFTGEPSAGGSALY